MIIVLLATLAASSSVSELQSRIDAQGLAWRASSASGRAVLENAPPLQPQNPLAGLWQHDPSPEGGITRQPSPATNGVSAASSWFDWANVGGLNYITDVRDQGGCGSCFTFSSLAAVEAQFAIALLEPTYELDLSEQDVMSCISMGSCEDGGLPQEVGMYLESSGTVDELCRPYEAEEDLCDGDLCADWSERVALIEGWETTLLPPSVEDLKESLLGGPVVVNFHVYDDFYWYESGVYSRTDAAQPSGWHAVLLTGWDDVDNSFIVKNSWGYGWGDNGYFKISQAMVDDCSWTFQDGVCFASNAVTFTVASREAPAFPCIAADSLELEAESGGEPVSASLEVRNCDEKGPLTWWPGPQYGVEVTSYDGELAPGASENVALSFDPAGYGAGDYLFSLPVQSQNGAELYVIISVTVLPGEETVANFVADDTGGVAPHTVHFENSSSGQALGYAWTFGDGGSSTAFEPTHRYDDPGTYTVKLTVSTASGNVVKTRQGYIVVTAKDDPDDDGPSQKAKEPESDDEDDGGCSSTRESLQAALLLGGSLLLARLLSRSRAEARSRRR